MGAKHPCQTWADTGGEDYHPLERKLWVFEVFIFRTLTIDNSDLGTIQPRAMAGMIDVHELKVINSKIDKVLDSVINEDTQVIKEFLKWK